MYTARQHYKYIVNAVILTSSCSSTVIVIVVLVCSLASSHGMDEVEAMNPPPLKPRLKKEDKECYNSWPRLRKPAPLPGVKQDASNTCISGRKPMPPPRIRTQLMKSETVDQSDRAFSDHCAVADDRDHKEPTLETMKIMMVSQLESEDMEQNVFFMSEGEQCGTNGMFYKILQFKGTVLAGALPSVDYVYNCKEGVTVTA